MENDNCGVESQPADYAGGDAERQDLKEALLDGGVGGGGSGSGMNMNADAGGGGGVDVVGGMEPEPAASIRSKENVIDKQSSDVVVVELEESVTSSTASRGKGKLRLFLEMNIKTKPTVVIPEGFVTPEPDLPNGDQQQEPISVTVDYPEDVMVTLNASVRRLEDGGGAPVRSRNNSQEDMDESIVRGWKPSGKGAVNVTPNAKKILNSTFIKPPLTSTLIYPILEETETTGMKNENFKVDKIQVVELNGTARKSGGSEQSSIYKTVLGDNEFGNISAIFKTEAEAANNENEKASVEDLDFIKQPSLTLNSKSKGSQAENLTPTEKLAQALHIIARYRGVWGVYENDTRIVTHLIRLNDLLSMTDSESVHNICCDEEFEEVKGLISYFVLEKRFVVRSQLLHTFSLLSLKSEDIGTFIFKSEIPVVLASEIAAGDFTSNETYDFAFCFLQLIASRRLSRGQCERIGKNLYYQLIEMIYCAQKHYHGRIAEMLFEILLNYHEQLREDDDIKFKSLSIAASGSRPAMQKIKQKLINFILKSVSTADDPQPSGEPNKKMKQIIVILNDWILCNATRELFNDAELDILLVSFTYMLERKQLNGVQYETVKIMHRILRNIQTEPSGMDRMLGLVERMATSTEPVGDDDYEHRYRTILKKMYRILTVE